MLPIQSDAIHLEKRTKIRLGHALMIPWPWVYKRIQFAVITEEDYSMQNVICFVTVV
jgi:hypothetical protein